PERRMKSSVNTGRFTWPPCVWPGEPDRKSTRLNSSHSSISYAVFCLKKMTIRTALTLEQIWTDWTELADWPQASKYRQWPSNAPNNFFLNDPVPPNFSPFPLQAPFPG